MGFSTRSLSFLTIRSTVFKQFLTTVVRNACPHPYIFIRDFIRTQSSTTLTIENKNKIVSPVRLMIHTLSRTNANSNRNCFYAIIGVGIILYLSTSNEILLSVIILNYNGNAIISNRGVINTYVMTRYFFYVRQIANHNERNINSKDIVTV